jgi:hypothetical protein
MTMETSDPLRRADIATRYFQWSPIIAGALAATALSFILVTFAAAVGLGVTSTAPTWRDASAALWILSGIYLILQAVLSFGVGGYVAGRTAAPQHAGQIDEVENRDGVHGLAVWALSVVLGAVVAGLIGTAAINRSAPNTTSARTSAAEPLLSYELDRLYRPSARRPAAVDLTAERAEAGRILLSSSSYNGVATEDRTYLIQQIGGTTGVSAGDAERRVDNAIANAKTAIARTRRSTVILAFSLATALLLGAVAAWAAAAAGGRHRDGAPAPEWMSHANRWNLRRTSVIP